MHIAQTPDIFLTTIKKINASIRATQTFRWPEANQPATQREKQNAHKIIIKKIARPIGFANQFLFT